MGKRIIDLSVDQLEAKSQSRHLSCNHLNCPYRADNASRSEPNRTVDCINDTNVDSDYLAMCPPTCKLSEEHGVKWVNCANWYQMRI